MLRKRVYANAVMRVRKRIKKSIKKKNNYKPRRRVQRTKVNRRPNNASWVKTFIRGLVPGKVMSNQVSQITSAIKTQEVGVVGALGETEKLQLLLQTAFPSYFTADSAFEKGKVLISQWNKVIKIVNSCNLPVTVHYWYVEPKIDIPLTYVQGTSDGYTATESFDALLKVLWDDNTAGTFYQRPGVSPFASEDLKAKFKVGNQKSKVLLPGEMLMLRTKINNVGLKTDNITKDGMFAFKKLSKMYLLSIQGSVAHDTTTESLIGYAASRVDIIEDITFSAYVKSGVVPFNGYIEGQSAIAVAQQFNINGPAEVTYGQ